MQGSNKSLDPRTQQLLLHMVLHLAFVHQRPGTFRGLHARIAHIDRIDRGALVARLRTEQLGQVGRQAPLAGGRGLARDRHVVLRGLARLMDGWHWGGLACCGMGFVRRRLARDGGCHWAAQLTSQLLGGR